MAAVICAAGVALLGVRQVADSVVSGGNSNARVAALAERPVQPIAHGSAMQVLADEWNDRIATDTFWRSGRNRNASQGSSAVTNTRPSRLQGPPPPPGWFGLPGQAPNGNFGQPQDGPRPASRFSSGYRTVCVRLCDGAFFPVSFGTSEGNLGRDQATCSNSCAGGRLFYGKAGNDDPDDMVDLSGQRYSKMANANLFRTQYVESCKCKPHAWEQAAVDRHRIYALEDQRRKGNRAIVAELEMLKAKQLVDKLSRNRRESSRLQTRQTPEAAARSTAGTTTDATIATAPRSDVSRGQGGERHASLGLTTGSINDATPPRPATAAVAPEASVPPGAVRLAPLQAPPPAPVPPASDPGGPDGTGQIDQNGRVPDAAHHAASVQGQEAVPSAVPPNKKNSRSRSRQAQSRTPQPGMMRVGASGLHQAAARPAPAPRRQGEWVSRIFTVN